MRLAAIALLASVTCAACALQAQQDDVAGNVASGDVTREVPSGVAVAKLPDWPFASAQGDATKPTVPAETAMKASPSSPVSHPESACMGQPCDPTPQPWEPDPFGKAPKK
jgi:hypothetical protein